METQDSDKPEEIYPTNCQPLSTFKRKKACKAVSFGTPIVSSPITPTPKFESMMKNILDKINFFAKADIIPLPEKPTRLQNPSTKSEENLKNQPNKEGLDKSPKTSKQSKKPKKITSKPDKPKPQKAKLNK